MCYNAGMKAVRAMMLGDLVGEPGLRVLEERLPAMIKENDVDFTVVNGENAADGFGITEATLKRIIAAGADLITSGNHVWEKREFWQTMQTEERVLRPANYPEASAGRGWVCLQKAGAGWTVINLQGRDLMPAIDCPFRSFDGIAAAAGASQIVLVDFHAESTREKEALAYYLDGRASLVAGTHTHVGTADERVLPKGTAYVTDLGMTGISNSVIGMDPGICLERMRRQVLYRMEPASDPAGSKSTAEIQGIVAEIDAESGMALSIRRL